jgi:hypothetical protein
MPLLRDDRAWEVREMMTGIEVDRPVGSRIGIATPGHYGSSADHTGRIVDVVQTVSGIVYVVVWDDGRTTFVPPEIAVVVDAR